MNLRATWERHQQALRDEQSCLERGREVVASLGRFGFNRDRTIDHRTRFITLTSEQRVDLLHFAAWAQARQDSRGD